jgi:hypothetical protein
MNIQEALNGLQGLNNNGGEMPRVRKAKKIEKIVSGKKHKNFKKPKGPLSIDLSKLGEDEVENNDPILSKLKEKYASKKYAKTSDKNTMKVKPTTGHESPNKMRGKMVGEADDTGMYNQRQTAVAQRQARADSQRNIVFDHDAFRQYIVQNHPNKTYAAVEQNLVKYQMEFQNAQNKAKGEKVLNKPKQDYKKYDEPAYKRAGKTMQQPKGGIELGEPASINKPASINTKVSKNPINSPITRANFRNSQKKR